MRRLLLAYSLIVVGLVAVVTTLAVLWWPAAVIFSGLALVVIGVFGIDVPPRVNRARRPEVVR